MVNRIPDTCFLGGYIYTHVLETCSRDRFQFAVQLEERTRPKYPRVKEEAVMEIKLDKDGKISDTAEIRSLLHYCLEYMHYTLGVYYLQPQDDIGVLTSSDWHITPQVIGKYDPTSEFAEYVECMLVYDAVFTTIPQSALSRSPQIEKKKPRHISASTDMPIPPFRPPPP